jgi:hypothetical protein
LGILKRQRSQASRGDVNRVTPKQPRQSYAFYYKAGLPGAEIQKALDEDYSLDYHYLE